MENTTPPSCPCQGTGLFKILFVACAVLSVGLSFWFPEVSFILALLALTFSIILLVKGAKVFGIVSLVCTVLLVGPIAACGGCASLLKDPNVQLEIKKAAAQSFEQAKKEAKTPEERADLERLQKEAEKLGNQLMKEKADIQGDVNAAKKLGEEALKAAEANENAPVSE